MALAIAVGLALVLFWMGVQEKQPTRAAERKTTEQREAGPYVANSKQISESENVRVLVIPNPLGEFFDVTCLIYTNKDLGVATMSCPTAHQGEISVPEVERR